MGDLEKMLQASVTRANAMSDEKRKALCEQVFGIPEEEIDDVEFHVEPPQTIVATIRLHRSIETVHTTFTIGKNGGGQ